jgi:DNA-binding IclR family transcriptional regulator
VRRHGYPGELWDNLNDETEFNRALEAVRSAGFYAIRHKELAGWGFPVMKRNGILGAVGCYVPLFRCTPKKEEMVMQKLRETAKILESEMRNGRTTTTSGEE